MPTRASEYGRAAQAAALAGFVVTAPCAWAEGAVSDAEALAIAHKHCVTCHAAKPAHPAFQEAPNNVTLETIPDLKKYAQRIYMQTVQNRAMPLGNQTGMTEDERAALGRWLKALP
ncbi:MAG: c-type cytochrome [Pseudolabrys sp.]